MLNLGLKKKSLDVEGMTCHHCEMTVEKAVLEIPEVRSAKADQAKGKVEIQYKVDPDLAKIKEKIEAAGYRFISES